MEKSFKVVLPKMPNFIRFEKKANLKQDGFKGDEGFDIKDLTEKEALEFAELMKQAFLEHHKQRSGKQLLILCAVAASVFDV